MSPRFISNIALGLAGAIVVVASQTFSSGVTGWVTFGVSLGALALLALVQLDRRRGRMQRLLDAATGGLALWSAVASVVYTGTTLTWLPDPLPPAYRKRLKELYDAMPPPPIPDDLFEGTPFGEIHEGEVEHEHRSSRDDVLAFSASTSWIANRDDRDEVLAGLASLLPEGEYTFHMRTNFEWAARA